MENKVDLNLRKDLFFLANIFILVTLISTLTIRHSSSLTLDAFKREDYILIAPFCAIIMGRAFYEILNIIKKFRPLFFLCVLIIPILLILDVLPFMSFINKIGSTDTTEEATIAQLLDVIMNLNHSKIYVDDNLLVKALRWNLYKREICGEEINYLALELNPGQERFEIVNRTLENENILYVFTFPTSPFYEDFLQIVKQFNKTIILEKSVHSKTKDVTYNIYRVL